MEIKEEEVLKKWLVWQKQAAITNAISWEMDKSKEKYDELKPQHDIEAAKCQPLMKAFKDAVKNL